MNKRVVVISSCVGCCNCSNITSNGCDRLGNVAPIYEPGFDKASSIALNCPIAVNSELSIFSRLSAAQIERLAVLVEEMGESLQMVGKVFRHGYEATDPTTRIQYNNKKDLETELGQVEHAISMLTQSDLDKRAIDKARIDRPDSIKNYMHHQG